jgi:hypothetical protein
MIGKLFDAFMRKLRRKYAYVDMYGDVRFYRYYVGYVELNDDKSWKARWLPNLFVHHFPGEPGEEGPDADQPHFHPWKTLSILLRGGYTHTVNDGEIRTVNAPTISYLSNSDAHQITRMTPGTWSLFFHGIRKHGWLIDARTCKTICDSCNRLNDGKCMKSNRIRPMAPETELSASDKAKGWRKAKWICVDGGFDKLLAERKRSIAALGKAIPIRSSEKFLILKESEIKVRKAAKNV